MDERIGAPGCRGGDTPVDPWHEKPHLASQRTPSSVKRLRYLNSTSTSGFTCSDGWQTKLKGQHRIKFLNV